ncbi:sugar ABC transporter ATP-binding protein [Labrenzia sp. OB1]|uniref:sugar ABC transporter ATP-binding protein n=1 Tax=Labrenzia sp. OB1 TaxID=1561204 RepID=UPI0007B2720C|nr:sugar ABC transporter ATP-binding protein [Labrenzia sp. OB1]KZM48984.1 sugar-transporting ATPase [Labrenzia sp. OB1]
MTNLILDQLTRHYGSVKALDGFTHEFAAGQVHALIGKNGSGKSTFVKMMSGAIQPTSGSIGIGNAKIVFSNPREAQRAGIATVYQELSLVPELSVEENIFLGRLPEKRTGLVDWAELRRTTANLFEEIGGLDIAPNTRVADLSVGQQQMVEIVKAMSFRPKVLQLDEPTSALAQAEVRQLFTLVRRLRDLGVTIIYITHRLSELDQIADTVTAIRDGKFVDSVPIKDAGASVILDMMFGDLPPLERPVHTITRDEPVLSARHLALAPHFEDVSFDLYPGEVLGIAGMLGSGRTELLHCLFGALLPDQGEIAVNGQVVTRPDIRTMKALGIGYTSEDRKHSGLVQLLSSHANLCLAGLGRIAPKGWISHTSERPFVDLQIAGLHIKAGDPMLPVSSLSGGNQQKIVVGNWMNNAPEILLFDEPARGVDVQAKRQIYELIWEKAREGLSSIVVSTELEDLTECCDRILVLRDGHIAEDFINEGLDTKDIYAACMAVSKNQPESDA